jgi:hypothetical protein
MPTMSPAQRLASSNKAVMLSNGKIEKRARCEVAESCEVKPAALRGSTLGAIGFDGSNEPITPVLIRIGPLRLSS